MSKFSCLSFEPVERPPWRNTKEINDTVPSVSEMTTQILEYANIWRKRRNKKEEQPIFTFVKKEMYLEFLYQIQVGEEIGELHKSKFEEIILEEVSTLNKRKRIKRENSEHPMQSTRKYKRLSLVDPTDCTTSQVVSERTEHRGDNSYIEDASNSRRLSSSDSLPSSLDADLFLEENLPEKHFKNTETINLLRGYRHLKNELNKIPKAERSGYLGIIDVECCILKCHEILMQDLMSEKRTAPGRFSILSRTAEFQGVQYFYPSYKTEDIAYDAVQAIVDQYNQMIQDIAKMKNEKQKLENSFKCASVLLFGFLTLHPFSDGNGRLARLLCSHCLKVFCPFPTAIYNVFSPSTRDDYITAIVNARKTLQLSPDQLEYPDDSKREALLILQQKPVELCSLIIESSWFTWRHFLRKIGENIPMLDFEQ